MSTADKMNILVVDDLPEKVLVLESILSELDENVITARSGSEALQKILRDDFAVILLDVNMPGMDGFETAELIRKRRKSAHTPIIFITGYADQVHTSQGYSLGAVDYIFSPVVPEILRAKVRVFVQLARMTQQAKRDAEERAARVATEAVLRRTMFLAEASRILGSSLDFEATLRGMLRIVVPELADLAALTLVDEQGQLRQTDLAWRNAANQLYACTVADSQTLGGTVADALRNVLATGKANHVLELDPARGSGLSWISSVETGEVRGTNEDCPLRSAAIFPLLARNRVLGALTLAMGHSSRRYETADLALAEDLASRAAIAIDNARLYRNVQEADRRKNEFLSMLAHELRNPLAPIRNAVQILRLITPNRPDLQPVQDMIDRQVHHLVRLVDDLLDISRITCGKIRLITEPVDVALVATRAVETSRPLLDERNHKLSLLLPEEPVMVRGDAVRLAQILTNLLNNAAKYTPEGGQVWLTITRDEGDVVFRVRDSGIGIPADMLSSVFDMFTQVDRSLDRSQGGLGLGLTLVRRLVTMHGGSVQAYSAGSNKGSEFVVRLPALQDEHLHGKVDDGFVGRPELPAGQHRILVVDDNVDAADSLARFLRLGGHEVCLVHDGTQALVATESFLPEIVILDIGLPGIDGYEVARRIRQAPGGSNLLLFALTGYGQEEDQRRSQEAGFDHHLVKPVDPQVFSELFATQAGRSAASASSRSSIPCMLAGRK